MSSDRGGFIYIAVNPAWPGYTLTGRTVDPKKRLSSYQTACPFRDFEFVACVWFPDHHTAERMLQERLGTDHEWAKIDSFFAVKTLNKLKEELIGE